MSSVDQQRLLDRFLAYSQADSHQSLKTWEKVNRDIEELCARSAPFNPRKIWQEASLTLSDRVSAGWRQGHVHFALPKAEVRRLLTELKKMLDHLYPKEFPSLNPISVRQWPLPAKIRRAQLQGRIAIRTDRKNKTVKTLVHFHKYYEAEPKGLFWFAFAELLEECGSLLRRCQECRTLFVKRTRQKVCSSACRIVRWRREHPEEARRIRRRAYERQVRKHHPRAKIASRPRERKLKSHKS